MIHIDDAGSGSLIGGTCIGILRTNDNQYYHEIIPIKYYDIENFRDKKYLDYVIDIIKRGFKKLAVTKNEKIKICQGYMFDKVRSWLDKNGYKWENATITGNLQDLIEKTFEKYTISLGFPVNYIKYTKYPFHFHRILRWVYSDYENRKRLCKTGWKSWQRYGTLNIKISYIKNTLDKRYYCLKCGKSLANAKNIKVMKYISNATNIIYLHENC